MCYKYPSDRQSYLQPVRLRNLKMRKRLVLLQALAILAPSDDPLFKWRITHQKMKKGMVYEVPCKDCVGLHWGSGQDPTCMYVGGWSNTRWQDHNQNNRIAVHAWDQQHMLGVSQGLDISSLLLGEKGTRGYPLPTTWTSMNLECGLYNKNSYCIKAISPLYHFSCCSLTVLSVPHGFYSM